MLDDAFQSSTDSVLNDLAQRPNPPRKQVPVFSMWGTITAAPRGAAAGGAQVAGSTADVLGAFGDVLATTEASAGGMFATQSAEERRQSQAATEQLRTQGVDFNSEAGRSFRNVARDYMPDAQTAHAAEMAVANLFRVGVKAVGGAALLGPMGGAVLAGAEEGFTTAEDLREQGVDLATRTKVGAVAGVLNAFGFALPVAGQTLKSTVGLALAGGPVSFVAQQAATREILAGAGYDQMASQYDPFDPVGLTLSTVLPLGFGALAMRGASKARMVPDEAVDAARVNLLSENLDAHRVTDATDLPAAAAQRNAITRAIDQMGSGERVEVTDTIQPAVAARASELMAERLRPLAAQLDELRAETRPLQLDVEEPPLAPLAKAAGEVEVAPGAGLMPDPEVRPGTPEPVAGLKPEDAALDARALELETSAPDTPVQLEGMDAPVSLRELMTRLREEVAQDLAEVPLIETAAACFIRAGAGAM